MALNRWDIVRLASVVEARCETLRDEPLAELRALAAACRRIADDSYGLCADCGAEIAPALLWAEPGATRCLPCEERHEKTYRALARDATSPEYPGLERILGARG